MTNMWANAPTAGDWGYSKYADCLQIGKNLHIDTSSHYETLQYPASAFSFWDITPTAWKQRLMRPFCIAQNSNQINPDHDSRRCKRKTGIQQHLLKCLRNAILLILTKDIDADPHTRRARHFTSWNCMIALRIHRDHRQYRRSPVSNLSTTGASGANENRLLRRPNSQNQAQFRRQSLRDSDLSWKINITVWGLFEY